jgi:aminoglycoside/choline kinase family phosphotransferase
VDGEGAKGERRVREAVRRACGREPRGLVWLSEGLGTRRFARVLLDGPEPHSLVARLEAEEDPAGRPAGVPPEPPLEPLRSRLEARGLPVPRRFGGEPGLDLLEDLGDVTLEVALGSASAERRRELYQEVLGQLPKLQSIADPDLPALGRRLDAALLAYKGRLFAEWSLPLALGRPARPAEAKVVTEAFAWIADALEAAPRRLAHRDLQSRNLLLHARRGEPRRLFWIDLQGAFLAPPEYDAVCLLRDSYVELPGAEIEALCAFLRPRLPDAPDPDTFARRFDLLTLTRKGKDHARFLYAAATRGERAYLAFLPATARTLKRAARAAASRDPALARLAELVQSLPESPCAP